MKGFIVDRTYRIVERDGKKEALVYLFGRLENGESFLTINTFRPYFSIKTKDLEKAKKIASFEHEETKLTNMAKEPVTKIITEENVSVLKEEYGTKPQVYYVGLSMEVK